MKVLFAVSNDNITTSVVSKYQQTYKEIITSKNVYYFNAIIKELQNDKTYDAIVIGEDLEPISNNNYEAIDKFLIEKLDRISDEASKPTGEDIPIIFICTERRSKSSQLLRRLFSMSIYNALIGNDRSVNMVCALINKPRNKKEAKRYYQIETDQAEYEKESEELVSEEQIQNILNYYKKIGSNETKCVEAFDSIANQYDNTQLRIIVKFLPMSVKAILETNSQTYQQLMTGGTVLSNGKYNKYKPEPPKNTNSLDFLEKDLEKTKLSEPVVIPSTMNLSNTQVASTDTLNNQFNTIQKPNTMTEPHTLNNQQYQNVEQNYNNYTTNSNNLYNNNYNLYNQQNTQSQYGAQDNPLYGQIDNQPSSLYGQNANQATSQNGQNANQATSQNSQNANQTISQNNQYDNQTTSVYNQNNNQTTQKDNQFGELIEPKIENLEPQIESIEPIETQELKTTDSQLQTIGESSLMSVQPMPVEPVKRGRGRPRKNPIETDAVPKVKRGRGRPRKNPVDELSPLPSLDTINPLPGVNPVTNTIEEPESANDTLNRLLGADNVENTNSMDSLFETNTIPNQQEETDTLNTLPGIDIMSEIEETKEDTISPDVEQTLDTTLPGLEDVSTNIQADNNLVNESGEDNMNNFSKEPLGNNTQNASQNNPFGMNNFSQSPYQDGMNNNQSPYGSNMNGFNQSPYGNGMNNNQNPYGVGMNNYNQSPYGSDVNNSNQNPYGNGINNNQNPYGVGMNNYNQSPYGSDMNNSNQNPYGNGTNSNQDPYGVGMNSNQNSYGNGINNNQNPYGNEMNNYSQNSYGSDMNNVNQNPYMTGSNLVENKNIVNNEPNGLVAKSGKAALFIGTTKNGTSFIVNNLASLLSNSGINTAIIDLTKNRNAYYMFTDNKAELMKIASNSLQNLQNGIIEGVKVNKNLTVYTGLPDDETEQIDPKLIMTNATSNYEIVLLDCDFATNSSYYTLANEIYLVQSMDAFTIQPLTKVLSELKNNNLLDENKLRVIINKYVKTSKLDTKMIIGGMSKYNEPAMTLQRDIFNPENIQSVVIPFEAQNYTKYIEDIAMCHLSLNGYSKSLVQSLEQLKDMVYPLIAGNNSNNNNGGNGIFGNNQNKKRRGFFGMKKEEDTTFSNDMNSTLDKMRTNY